MKKQYKSSIIKNHRITKKKRKKKKKKNDRISFKSFLDFTTEIKKSIVGISID